MKNRKRKLAWFMSFLLLLTGCAKEQDIPELLDPVVNTESFRPVEYGGVAKTEIEMADVVPEEYCHFMQKAAQISEITVDLGQYVKEGDLLAVMDVTEWQEQLAAKEKELDLQRTLFSYQEKICGEQIKEQKLKKQDYKESGEKKEASNCDTQISVLEENRRYDTLLEKHRETMLNEEIAELREMVAEGTIKATHAGYVTYVKDLAQSDEAEAYENVVIVSDDNFLHLELQKDMSSDCYAASKNGIYDEIYTLLDGAQCNAKLYVYSNQELIAFQSASAYPQIRLEVDNLENKAMPGDKIPVYFKSSKEKKTLRVGMDSVYSTGNQYFVYVRNGDSKEKREIQIGYHNDIYAEVTEGLSEGEWVYYSSNAIMPEQYEEYTVEKQDYAPTGSGLGVKANLAYTQIYSYTQKEDAVVESIYFAKGDMVNKGDLICTLKTKPSKAKLKEMQQNISEMKESHKESIKEYDKQITDLEKQIKKVKKQYAKQSKASEEQKKESASQAEEMEQDNRSESAIDLSLTSVGTDSEIPSDEQAVSSDKTSEQENGQSDTSTEQPSADAGQTDGKDTSSSEESNTENSENEVISATMAQQLECQKAILEYEKKSAQAQYDYSYNMMQKEYDDMLKSNNGTGKLDIYAKQSGVLGNLNIYEDKQIKAEQDTHLFQIYEESSKKLSVNTKNDYIGTGNKVTLKLKEDDKVYQGTVIGNSAMRGKVYVTTRNQKVYTTRSNSWTDGNQAYIAIPEEMPSDMTTAEVSYSSARLRNVVVLPSALVNEEVNTLNPEITHFYVWKIIDGNFVKQYVQIAQTSDMESEICILEGLESGDILANPILNQG